MAPTAGEKTAIEAQKTGGRAAEWAPAGQPLQRAYRARRGGHGAVRPCTVGAVVPEMRRPETPGTLEGNCQVPWKGKRGTLEGAAEQLAAATTTWLVDGHTLVVRAGSDKVLVAVSRFFCFPIQIFFSGNVFSGQNQVERGPGPKSVAGPMRRERVQPTGGTAQLLHPKRVRGVEIQRNCPISL